MAYTLPTVQSVRDRFPEFTVEKVGDSRVQMFLDEAARYVDQSWLEADYAPAIRFLAAHMMAQEGVLAPAGTIPGAIASGPITAFSLGDASVTYASPQGGGSGGEFRSGLQLTAYGRRFLVLLNNNSGGPVVV